MGEEIIDLNIALEEVKNKNYSLYCRYKETEHIICDKIYVIFKKRHRKITKIYPVKYFIFKDDLETKEYQLEKVYVCPETNIGRILSNTKPYNFYAGKIICDIPVFDKRNAFKIEQKILAEEKALLLEQQRRETRAYFRRTRDKNYKAPQNKAINLPYNTPLEKSKKLSDNTKKEYVSFNEGLPDRRRLTNPISPKSGKY